MAINKRLIKSNEGGAAVATSFNTVTYTGTNTTRSITGVGFQPDLVWIKARTAPNSHTLMDVIRTAPHRLFSNATNAESTTNGLISFDSDGFTMGDDATSHNMNASGVDYVAWNWKAGGAAVTNTDGTITSQVSANTEAGFSVVSYTGSGTQPSTIGHGLNATPDVVILKDRDISFNWHVYHSAVMTGGDAKYLRLNTTDAILTDGSDNVWDSGFNNQTFGVGRANNRLNNKTIAYCFAEVEGFSNFGSYVGTDTRQGIVTGFEPAFVMIKRTDAANAWFMIDNKRFVTNRYDRYLLADSSGSEGGLGSTQYVEFYENGFSVETGSGLNGSGGSYIYMAFANQF